MLAADHTLMDGRSEMVDDGCFPHRPIAVERWMLERSGDFAAANHLVNVVEESRKP